MSAPRLATDALRKWSADDLAHPQAANRLRRSFGVTPADAACLIAAEVARR